MIVGNVTVRCGNFFVFEWRIVAADLKIDEWNEAKILIQISFQIETVKTVRAQRETLRNRYTGVTFHPCKLLSKENTKIANLARFASFGISFN